MKATISDFFKSMSSYKELSFLGVLDVKQRYRRSSLGPFWITIATSLNIAGLAIVFGAVFQAPYREYVPYLACGLVLWAYLSTSVLEASDLLIDQRHTILERRISMFELMGRLIFRNFYIFLHNFFFLIFLTGWLSGFSLLNLFMALVGVLLFSIFIFFCGISISIIGARFRDLSPMLGSMLQMGFYFTPIVWSPSVMIERGRSIIVNANPLYHLMELARAPLLGEIPSFWSYVTVFTMIFLAAYFAGYSIKKFGPRVSYWV